MWLEMNPSLFFPVLLTSFVLFSLYHFIVPDFVFCYTLFHSVSYVAYVSFSSFLPSLICDFAM
jgi:hypothetical protein